jgi:hypothetical protein
MILKGLVTQTGADTYTSSQLLTGLTVDGKSGWEITGFKAYFANGYTAAATDAIMSLSLATIATATTPASENEIARIAWAVQNTAGVAVAFNFEPAKKADMTESRITVQSDLYINCASTTTGLACNVYYEIAFNIIKLSDIEVLRLAVGGA